MNNSQKLKKSIVSPYIKEIIYEIINTTLDELEIDMNHLKKTKNFHEIEKNQTYYQLIYIDNSFYIKYYKLIEQPIRSSLCGYYVLYNSICYIQTKKENNQLEQLKNSSFFNKFYMEIKNFLITTMKLEESAIKELKNDGALERYQFRYLLEYNKSLKNIFSSEKNMNIQYLFLFFGYERFNHMNNREVSEIEKKILSFYGLNEDEEYNKCNYHDMSMIPKKENSNNILIIFIGCTYHWSLLIIDKDVNDELNFNYFDSKQDEKIFLMKGNKENVVKHINKINESYIKLGISPLNKWKFDKTNQWYCDIYSLILILYKTVKINYKYLRIVVVENALKVIIMNNDLLINNKNEIIKHIKPFFKKEYEFLIDFINDVYLNNEIQYGRIRNWELFMNTSYKVWSLLRQSESEYSIYANEYFHIIYMVLKKYQYKY